MRHLPVVPRTDLPLDDILQGGSTRVLLTFSLRTRKFDLSVKIGRLIVLGVILAISPATRPIIDELGANGAPAITMGQHAMAIWLGSRANSATPTGRSTSPGSATREPASEKRHG